MALSAQDKREIANMLQAFSERMTTGRQVKSAEEQVLDAVLARALDPMSPLRGGPRFAPLEERVLGEVIETATIPRKRKKRMSQFNRAVKEGVAIVKASTSYGKKGIVKTPRKAFTAVTKTVSKVRKGKAAPKKGVLGKVARAARKRFKGLKIGRLA